MNSPSEVPFGWYLAELVVEIVVGSDVEKVIHVLLVLVEARDPEEAYQLSNALGLEHDDKYLNPKGESVTSQFVGLRNFSYIDEELVHGTEIGYEETISPIVDNSPLPVRAKERLDVFDRSRGPTRKKPDYSYAEIVTKARAIMTKGDVPPNSN